MIITQTKMKTLADKIREMASKANIIGSQYTLAEKEDGSTIKIRVSNHSGNESNNSTETISFVTEMTEQRKSAYNRMITEYVIDEEGNFSENFYDLEECLAYNDIKNEL